MINPIYLDAEEIRDLADPADYVEAVRQGFLERGNGGDANTRERVHRRDPSGMLTSYMAILPESDRMGGYMYSAGFSDRDAYFLTPLFDAESGQLLALLDGSSMNPFKTGAAGAIAVDELAVSDVKRVAVIGSGPQARGQTHGLMQVRSPELINVFSPTPEHRERFAEEMTGVLEADVRAVSSAGEAIDGAEVIITATTSHEPVFDGSALSGGEHITAMGQYHRERREVDARAVARSTYVPDIRDRVLEDAGAFLMAREEGVITDDHIHAELGEVVAGEAEGRTAQDEITLFDSGGTGIETTAAAAMLYEKAREEGVGTPLSMYSASEMLTGRTGE
jgi:alanine dehydrogenase